MMIQNAQSTRQSVSFPGQSVHVNRGEGRPFLFSFCLLLESVNRNPGAGMVFAAYIIWPTATQYCAPTFFLLFLDLASPSISLVLQPDVKSRMRPSYCVPSCDVTKLADRTSRVRRKLGSNTRLFLALLREFQIFKK